MAIRRLYKLDVEMEMKRVAPSAKQLDASILSAFVSERKLVTLSKFHIVCDTNRDRN